MTEWDYLWRQTYWAERGRSGDYVQWVHYEHVWKPDKVNEVQFPDQDGLSNLGREGWELVTMMPTQVALVSRSSPQQGDSYANFTVCLLMFKRSLS